MSPDAREGKEHDSVFLPQDGYYRSVATSGDDEVASCNFDKPAAFGNRLLYEHLSELKKERAIGMSCYHWGNLGAL